MRQFGFLKRNIKADIQKKSLPTPQDIVAVKRQRIKDELQEIVADESFGDYTSMADELLAEYEPQVALGALLRLAFRSELDESQYPEIRSFSVDRKGTARLFIGIGRDDGYDVRKLVGLLKRECGLRDKHINDVKLGDSYSFVSVPFGEAEEIVHKLNALRRGKRPLAEIANPAGETGYNEPKPRKERRSDRQAAGDAVSDERTEAKPRRERKTQRDDRTDRRTSRRSDGERSRTSDRTQHPTSGPRPQQPYFEIGEGDAEERNSGFDWSFFERGGNTWERPAKGKKKRK